MPARIVVIGGASAQRSRPTCCPSSSAGGAATVTVVDATGMHHYQPGYFYVALGQANGRWLARDERTLPGDDVELVVDRVASVDGNGGDDEEARGGALGREPGRAPADGPWISA